MLRAGPMSGDGGSHAGSTKPFSRPCKRGLIGARIGCVCAARRSSIPSGESWMGATHFQMKALKNVSTEMALHDRQHETDNEHSWRRRVNESAPHLKPVVRTSDAPARA